MTDYAESLRHYLIEVTWSPGGASDAFASSYLQKVADDIQNGLGSMGMKDLGTATSLSSGGSETARLELDDETAKAIMIGTLTSTYEAASEEVATKAAEAIISNLRSRGVGLQYKGTV